MRLSIQTKPKSSEASYKILGDLTNRIDSMKVKHKYLLKLSWLSNSMDIVFPPAIIRPFMSLKAPH